MFNFTKAVRLDLLAFLKNPEDKPDPIQTWSEKAKKLFSLLILDIPIMILLIGVLSGLQAVGLFNDESNKLGMLINTMPVWILIFVLVILIPFFEELIFRLYLRYKYNYLARFFIFLSLIAGVKNHDQFEVWLSDFCTKRYLFIFYFSALLFGYVHLTNYNNSISIILLSPIIIAPQFISGLFIGYLRVRHDLVTGYLMHALHNAIFVCIPLLFMADVPKRLTIETDDYTLKIEESIRHPKESTGDYHFDGVEIRNTSLKKVLIDLIGKKELLLNTNNDSLLNQMINLTFRSKLKNNPPDRRYSLNQLEREDVISQLSGFCNFKEKKEHKPHEVWELHVEDSTLLARNRADSIIPYKVNVTPENVSATNSSTWILIKGLSQSSKRIMTDQTFTKKRYTFNVKVTDFDTIQNQLRTKYGLCLKKVENNLEFTTIEFSKKK